MRGGMDGGKGKIPPQASLPGVCVHVLGALPVWESQEQAGRQAQATCCRKVRQGTESC